MYGLGASSEFVNSPWEGLRPSLSLVLLLSIVHQEFLSRETSTINNLGQFQS